MAESPFSFEWRRPTGGGYGVVEVQDIAGHSRSAIWRIGGEDIVYDPLKFEALHRTFASIDAVMGAAIFANEYGLLSREGHRRRGRPRSPFEGEDPNAAILIDQWLEHAEQVRSILGALIVEGTQAATEALNQAMTWRLKPALLSGFPPETPVVHDGLDAPSFGLRIVQSPKRHEQRITVQPTNLLSVIYLMLAREITEGRDYQQCEMPGCNNWSAVGKHTGHRRHRKYCSDRCRVAAHRLKSKTAKGNT